MKKAVNSNPNNSDRKSPSSFGSSIKGATLFFAIVGLMSACGSNDSRNVWKLSAPSSPSETGVVVHLNGEMSKNQFEIYLQTNGLQGRVIHSNEGVFEVFGAAENELRKSLPNSIVYKNEYYENLIEGVESKPSLSLLEDATASEDDGRCKTDDPEGPAAVIMMEAGQGLQVVDSGKVGDLTNGNILLNAQQSNSIKGPLSKVYWQVKGPSGSKIPSDLVTGEKVKVNLDSPGVYTVGLLVVDKDNSCNIARTSFAITYNVPFKGHGKPRSFTADDRETFHHLGLIQAESAWKVSKGAGVKIAVIDTGVNYNHSDLSVNIFENAGEIPGNGLDDDQNGFVDDTNGWDFVFSDNAPVDDQGHGTHVSGLAASAVSGVARDATIIPIKALNTFGGGDIASIVGAIMYAVDMDADVINMSLGGGSATLGEQLKPAFDYAESRGVVIAAAAGNGHPYYGYPMDNDQDPVFPANLPNTNIIAVAATNASNELTEYSNFGFETVDIAAPGGSRQDLPVQATNYWPQSGENYVGLMGTSMATPIAAGAMAVILSEYPDLSPVELKELLQNSSVFSENLKGKVASEGVISVKKALIYKETSQGSGRFPEVLARTGFWPW